jgi:hypothetical protein
LIRTLNPDALHTKAPGNGGEISRAKPDELFSSPRPIAGGSAHPSQVLAEAGIVVDDDDNLDAAAPRRLEFR